MDFKNKAKSRDDAVRVSDMALLHVHLFQEEQKRSSKVTAPGRGPATLPAAALPSTNMSIFLPAPTSSPKLLPITQPTLLKSGPNGLNPEFIQKKEPGGCRDENKLDKSTAGAASLSPHHHDVIFGRGKVNHYFNNFIKAVIIEFVVTPKQLRSFFVIEVVNQIRSLSPPGRFLCKDKETGVYFEVCNKKTVLKKTSQALRNVKLRLDVERKIESGEINVKEEITYRNIPDIVHKKAMKAYAETFPHSISIQESTGGQGPTYGRLALDSSSTQSIQSMMYNDSSTWEVDNRTLRNAHAKMPDPSSFPRKDAPTFTNDVPLVSSTSDARMSTSLSPYFLRSSGAVRAGDGVSDAHHDPTLLGIDCFTGMESEAVRVTGQPQCDHHNDSRSTGSRSPSLFSYESANFDLEMLVLFQDPGNDTTKALDDGE